METPNEVLRSVNRLKAIQSGSAPLDFQTWAALYRQLMGRLGLAVESCGFTEGHLVPSDSPELEFPEETKDDIFCREVGFRHMAKGGLKL